MAAGIFDVQPGGFLDLHADAVDGHPQPVVDPPNGSRRCLSMYYYSKERPLRELMLGRHSVVFSEEEQAPARSSRAGVVRELVTPPIVARGLRRVQQTIRRVGDHPMSQPAPRSVGA
jgi:hypothetical protein